MANYMQIIEINSQGTKTVFHPETDADYVLQGKVNKVPTIVNIEDWLAKSKEVVDARKGSATLRAKIDLIDNALLPNSILEAIKKVDGSGSGLDADLVDGRTVNDSGTTSSDLWTANKIKTELDKKLNSDQVTTIAEANKILRMNAGGLLETSITKNAATATRLQAPLTIKMGGDVVGELSFAGNEKEVDMSIEVRDNSHNHSKLSSTSVPVLIGASSGDKIVSFSIEGEEKSFIDDNGVYQGSCAFVNGVSIDNSSKEKSLWTSDKIFNEINTIAESKAIDSFSVGEEFSTIGPFKLYKGVVDVGGVYSVDINIPLDLSIISENYVLNAVSAGIVHVKKPGENTILFSKQPEMGTTLSWYVMGV